MTTVFSGVPIGEPVSSCIPDFRNRHVDVEYLSNHYDFSHACSKPSSTQIFRVVSLPSKSMQSYAAWENVS